MKELEKLTKEKSLIIEAIIDHKEALYDALDLLRDLVKYYDIEMIDDANLVNGLNLKFLDEEKIKEWNDWTVEKNA